MNNDWKHRLGVVFSTNPDFSYEREDEAEPEAETLPPHQQKLHVRMERAGRKGKTVTDDTGIVGTLDELQALAKRLKTRQSKDGTAQAGEIVIQGDVRPRALELLKAEGDNAR